MSFRSRVSVMIWNCVCRCISTADLAPPCRSRFHRRAIMPGTHWRSRKPVRRSQQPSPMLEQSIGICQTRPRNVSPSEAPARPSTEPATGSTTGQARVYLADCYRRNTLGDVTSPTAVQISPAGRGSQSSREHQTHGHAPDVRPLQGNCVRLHPQCADAPRG